MYDIRKYFSIRKIGIRFHMGAPYCGGSQGYLHTISILLKLWYLTFWPLRYYCTHEAQLVRWGYSGSNTARFIVCELLSSVRSHQVGPNDTQQTHSRGYYFILSAKINLHPRDYQLTVLLTAGWATNFEDPRISSIP